MVDYDSLDYEGIYLYRGKPYTGFAGAQFPDGALECQFEFKNGQQDGFVREWYPSGQICSETRYEQGIRHGPETTWHDNGVLCHKRLYERGRLIENQSFDRDGKQIVNSR
jgi:antitoxin component YwqK of YwqJK toxin-antitoxin module